MASRCFGAFPLEPPLSVETNADVERARSNLLNPAVDPSSAPSKTALAAKASVKAVPPARSSARFDGAWSIELDGCVWIVLVLSAFRGLIVDRTRRCLSIKSRYDDSGAPVLVTTLESAHSALEIVDFCPLMTLVRCCWLAVGCCCWLLRARAHTRTPRSRRLILSALYCDVLCMCMCMCLSNSNSMVVCFGR
jgi:hypothetical protein